jgi:hypothetical protein
MSRKDGSSKHMALFTSVSILQQLEQIRQQFRRAFDLVIRTAVA